MHKHIGIVYIFEGDKGMLNRYKKLKSITVEYREREILKASIRTESAYRKVSIGLITATVV